MAEGYGSWLEYICFPGEPKPKLLMTPDEAGSDLDDDVWWKVSYNKPEWMSAPQSLNKATELLHSDSSFRPDLKQLIVKNFDEAERLKSQMEND